MQPRVIVFVDYENMLRSAHEEWAPEGAALRDSIVDPLKLGERLVANRAPGGVLTQVRVYRGRPNPDKQRKLASANDQQKMAWEEDPRVIVNRRMLRYPDEWTKDNDVRAEEKGIDVRLAVDLVRLAFTLDYDVAIVFSRDTDLVPAVEVAYDLDDVHVEVATWAACGRIGLDDGRFLFCHRMSENDWVAVRDTRRYHVLGDGSVPRIQPRR